MLVAFAQAKDDRAAAITEHYVAEFEIDQIADTAAGEQEQMEDRRRPNVAPKFDLPQQFSYLGTVQALGGKLLPLQFLHFSCWISRGMALFNKPIEETPHRDQRPIHGRHCLPVIPTKVIPKTGHVTSRHPADSERLSVGLGEPVGEFAQVLFEGSSGVRAEIVLAEEAVDEARFAVANRHGSRIIIGGIFHGLFPGSSQEVDSQYAEFRR